MIVLWRNTLARGEKTFCAIAQNAFFPYTIVTNVLLLELNMLRARSNFHPASYTCSYKQFSSMTSLEIATHGHSPSKTGGSHTHTHLRVRYTHNSILCWNKQPSSSLS